MNFRLDRSEFRIRVDRGEALRLIGREALTLVSGGSGPCQFKLELVPGAAWELIAPSPNHWRVFLPPEEVSHLLAQAPSKDADLRHVQADGTLWRLEIDLRTRRAREDH